MSGVLQQEVAFPDRFRDQPDLAVLEISQAAMRDPCGAAAGAGAEILPVDDRTADPLQGKVAKRRGTIDSGPDDQHVESSWDIEAP